MSDLGCWSYSSCVMCMPLEMPKALHFVPKFAFVQYYTCNLIWFIVQVMHLESNQDLRNGLQKWSELHIVVSCIGLQRRKEKLQSWSVLLKNQRDYGALIFKRQVQLPYVVLGECLNKC